MWNINQDGREKYHPAPHHTSPITLMISADTMDQIFEGTSD